MNTELPTSEVLNRAADLIEEHGWAVGNQGMTAEGPHCVMGAIGSASGLDALALWDGRPAFVVQRVADTLAAQGLARFVECRPRSLWLWNDLPGRTAEQVIATLRAAALIEAAKERPANLVIFDAPTLAEAVGA